MEVPPTYVQPQRKKTKVGWIIAIVLACIACCCGAPAVFLMRMYNNSKPMLSCAMAFKDVADGIRKYAGDHKGVLPKAETWQDDVKDDYQNAVASEPKTPFSTDMPANGDWACIDGDGHKTGISYNSDVAGKKLDSVGDQVSTILIFETDKVAKNLHAKYTQPDFQASPKIIMGQPRGWMVATVSGETGLVEQNGKLVPVNVTGGRGVSVNVNAGSGPIDVIPKKSDTGDTSGK